MGQEDEEEKRKKIFTPYQVNEKLLSYAKPNSIVMHCLPANRGEEITDEVMDGHHSVVFDEAENRLHIQKAILTMLCDSQNDHLQTQSQTLKSKRKSVRW
jgi:ornithine carbamoyltransferase